MTKKDGKPIFSLTINDTGEELHSKVILEEGVKAKELPIVAEIVGDAIYNITNQYLDRMDEEFEDFDELERAARYIEIYIALNEKFKEGLDKHRKLLEDAEHNE